LAIVDSRLGEINVCTNYILDSCPIDHSLASGDHNRLMWASSMLVWSNYDIHCLGCYTDHDYMLGMPVNACGFWPLDFRYEEGMVESR
jgi:hypothetical protein